jgi:hypothetical protein
MRNFPDSANLIAQLPPIFEAETSQEIEGFKLTLQKLGASTSREGALTEPT